MNKLFQIGGFCFRLICSTEVLIPNNFLKFEISYDSIPEYTYHLHIVNQLPTPDGNLKADRNDLMVFDTKRGEERLIGVKGEKNPYGSYCEINSHEAEISILSSNLNYLQIDTFFTALFALERQMIRRERLILHCAYVKYKGKAILFSAPSGVGKSTQASLWEKYRGGCTVNGDRALLGKEEGSWMASGWPICGSSDICKLCDTPIYAIVMLRQGKINHVEKLSVLQAFSMLYPQITINQWNRNYVQEVVEKLEDLLSVVPVWQLTCDISENAVQCLEDALFSN